MLGRSSDHPHFDALRPHIPYSLEEDEERGTFVIRHSDNETFYAEEIAGMRMRRVRDMAIREGSDAKDCVITVRPCPN